MTAFDIGIASVSDRGRRAANEDALRAGSHGTCRYAVLADGAGGHERGAEAALHVVERVAASLCAPALTFTPQTLTSALQQVHAELQDEQVGSVGRSRMHATVVVLWIDGQGERAVWSHIGDSRLYRIRYGVVDCVTADDSVVQRLLESGTLTPEQAERHPLKNQLIAALGMQEAVEPHTLESTVALEDGDVFLLCTDGWWGVLGDADILATLRDADTPQEWLDTMRARIDARGEPAQDNYSAIAVWVTDPTECTHPMDEAWLNLALPNSASFPD